VATSGSRRQASVARSRTRPRTRGDDPICRLQAQGRFVYANGLASSTTATVVDGQGDSPLVTDGPYLESEEYLGGFWIIEAGDLDQALALAAKGSKACQGKVEVRPFQ
jgi:hypothetical protein